MITGKVQYKSKKLTLDQRALKKAIGPFARRTRDGVRGEVPRVTGSLRFSVDYRQYSAKGNAVAVVGVRANYSRTVGGTTKIPQLYAEKAGVKRVLARYCNRAAVDSLARAVAAAKQDLLRGNVEPEPVLAAALVALFSGATVGPAGTWVQHESGDPVSPEVLYRRTGTTMSRDLAGNLKVQLVDFDVSVESMFFSQCVGVTMPDFWIDEDTGWSFELVNVEADSQDFRVVWSYLAVLAS